MIIVFNIKGVDKEILSFNEDHTVCATLHMNSENYGSEFKLPFANGRDQSNDTTPEGYICK